MLSLKERIVRKNKKEQNRSTYSILLSSNLFFKVCKIVNDKLLATWLARHNTSQSPVQPACLDAKFPKVFILKPSSGVPGALGQPYQSNQASAELSFLSAQAHQRRTSQWENLRPAEDEEPVTTTAWWGKGGGEGQGMGEGNK